MALAILLLYVAVIVGFLFDARLGAVLALVALILDLVNAGGRVG